MIYRVFNKSTKRLSYATSAGGACTMAFGSQGKKHRETLAVIETLADGEKSEEVHGFEFTAFEYLTKDNSAIWLADLKEYDKIANDAVMGASLLLTAIEAGAMFEEDKDLIKSVFKVSIARFSASVYPVIRDAYVVGVYKPSVSKYQEASNAFLDFAAAACKRFAK